MSQDETNGNETNGTERDSAPSRALVALSPPRAAPAHRARPRADFLTQLATGGTPALPRSLRAPEALRRYAVTAALLDAG